MVFKGLKNTYFFHALLFNIWTRQDYLWAEKEEPMMNLIIDLQGF